MGGGSVPLLTGEGKKLNGRRNYRVDSTGYIHRLDGIFGINKQVVGGSDMCAKYEVDQKSHPKVTSVCLPPLPRFRVRR